PQNARQCSTFALDQVAREHPGWAIRISLVRVVLYSRTGALLALAVRIGAGGTSLSTRRVSDSIMLLLGWANGGDRSVALPRQLLLLRVSRFTGELNDGTSPPNISLTKPQTEGIDCQLLMETLPKTHLPICSTRIMDLVGQKPLRFSLARRKQ